MLLSSWLASLMLKKFRVVTAVWLLAGGLSLAVSGQAEYEAWTRVANEWLARAQFHVESRTIQQLEESSNELLHRMPDTTMSIRQSKNGNIVWSYPLKRGEYQLRGGWDRSKDSGLYFYKVQTLSRSIFSNTISLSLIYLLISILVFFIIKLVVKRAVRIVNEQVKVAARPFAKTEISEFDELNATMSDLLERLHSVQSEAEVGRAYSRLAHDLRAPIGVLNYVSSSGTLEREHRELIGACATRIRDLTNEVLRVRKNCDFSNHETFIQVALTQEARRQNKDIHIQTSLSPLVALSADDRGEVYRHILNLAFNSIDAIVGKGHLTVSAVDSNNLLEIVVEDTAGGVPPDVVSALLRGAKVRSKKASGNGIGLQNFVGWLGSRGLRPRFEASGNVGRISFVAGQKQFV